MKLQQLSVATALASTPSFVGSYVCGPTPGRTRAYSPEEQAKRAREQEEQVKRSFEDLREDVRRQKQGSFVNVGRFGPYSYGFNMDEEALRRQRDFANKVFDLAEEFISEFVVSKDEAKMNEELLEKTRGWVNGMYQAKEKSETGDEEGKAEATSKMDTDGEVTFTPMFDVYDSSEKFEIFMDVPGVDRGDIDVSVEEGNKILIISGVRNVGPKAGSGDNEVEARPSRKKFSQRFHLDEDVEVEQLTAKLDRGVLIISAPKRAQPEEKGESRKIPLI